MDLIMHVLSYTTRSKTGTNDQYWAPDVYLTDDWQLYDSEAETIEDLKKLNVSCDLHYWSLVEISDALEPHWLD